MNSEGKIYDRILKTLRKSKPQLTGIEDIEENVMRRILLQEAKKGHSKNLFYYLFSWVYVGWVRTSLVAASILIVILFGYQQAMILKRVNSLTEREILKESLMVTGTDYEIRDKLLLNKLTEGKSHDRQVKISERQMKRLIKAVNELQLKYDDLMKVIEDNPDLKKYIDEKLTENNRGKLKL